MKERDLKIVEQDIVNSSPDDYWGRFLKTCGELNAPVIIDISKIRNSQIWENIHDRPYGAIQQFEEEAAKITGQKNPKLRIRFINVSRQKNIRDLRHNDAGKLVAIKCLVKRVTQVDSKVLEAVFRCDAGHFNTVTPVNEVILKPFQCDQCNSKKFKAASSRYKRVDRQFLYVQEQLEDLEGAVQPASLRCEVTEDLCNIVSVGDRVTVNGFVRLRPKMKGGELTSTEELFFEVNSIEMELREFDEIGISDEEEIEIRRIAEDPEIFSRISNSIASSILGMKLAKSVIALQLFGGVNKTMKDGLTVRGYINVLMVTDPGMAKTQLLRYAARIAPRGIFTNATTSTKVGLVASVMKDETTGQYCIEAGAYMLANKGLICVDEFSELNKEDSKIVNEAMENGEAHISKAGINTSVRTMAAMLGACNPEKGRFVLGVPFSEQVDIDPSVLSRFDVVILLQDIASSTKDAATADFILDSHMEANDADSPVNDRLIDPDMLRKYIAYARRINPKLSKEAKKIISDFYVKTRPSQDTGDTIAITTRQVPALVRLSEAHARLRLSETVSEADALAAIEILKISLNSVAYDPVTGAIDEDRISNRFCAQSRNFRDVLIRTVNELAEGGGYAKEEAICGGMAMKGYPAERVNDGLVRLGREGILIQVRNGLWRVMK